MRQLFIHVAGAMAFSLGLGCLVGCGGSSSSSSTPTKTTPTITWATPASIVAGTALSATQLDATASVAGTFVYTPAAGTVESTAGSVTLSTTFTPTDTTNYNTATASVTLTVTAAVTKMTPTVTVTPSLTFVDPAQALMVMVTVSGGSSNATPTGSVTLTGGGYSSTGTLANGSYTFTITAGALTTGSATLTATYTPDTASSSTYGTATGTSSAITVSSTVTVTTPSTTLAVTGQILGMNLAAWYDVVTNKTTIVNAFQTAGIKAMRWPGGSWSDDYHWGMNGVQPYMCQTKSPVTGGWAGYGTFAQFVTSIVKGGAYDLALTANYGSNEACTGGGDPAEAAAWVASAKTLNANVTHMTVGNEVYGSTWETDLHSSAHDPTTYAAAVAGTSGYYDLIKAADSTVKVGVVVEPNYAPWDQNVLSGANGFYDFVEYHYYPESPGSENDTTLMTTDVQKLTTNIKTIKAELVTAGKPDTPIYIGEIGGPYSNPGKQSWSITQGLYAGQVLGEVMNDGVSRLTWWIGFGNCTTPASNGNDSALLYGWQDFGAYNVFSDGTSDSDCPGAGDAGTMSPTARAFQLFSNVAVTGESVLTAAVSGDTTDVRAYAATHDSGKGTAVVLFNLNETTSEPVTITVPAPATASTVTPSSVTIGYIPSFVTVITYDKAIYDLSGSPTGVFPDANGTSTWADPTTTILTSPTLPLNLTLTPWSMNVVLIE